MRTGRPSWAAVLLSLLVFGAVTAALVAGGWLPRLDHRVADGIASWQLRETPLVLKIPLYLLTEPGDRLTVVFVGAPLVWWLAASRRSWRPAVRYAIAMALLGVAVTALKHGFGRLGPNTDALFAGGRSYPSGHSATAVVLWGVLATCAAEQRVRGLLWWRLIAYAAPVVTAVGMLLLDFHWLSDLFAGLALGVVVLRVAAGLADVVLRHSPGAPDPSYGTDPAAAAAPGRPGGTGGEG